jgi:hypothetical protein
MDIFNGPFWEANTVSNSRAFRKVEAQPATTQLMNTFLEADQSHVNKTRPAVASTSTAIRNDIRYF